MKKIAVLLLALALFSGCMESWYAIQHQFSVETLMEISPYGLIYENPVGKNWWEGTYRGSPVLIHAVKVKDYVYVDFQYVEEK